MARIRTIKPETFDDPDLCALPMACRWLFVGLWTQADKAGRLEDDPRRLKARLLAFDHKLDCDQLLSRLAPKFITRYSANGCKYIQINNFVEHQRPHPRESESAMPPPPPVEAVKSRDEPEKAGTSKVDSGSGNGSLDHRSGKDGSREPSPVPVAVSPPLKPLGYKPRIDVAWPGRPPVPGSLHAEFVSKLGGNPEDAGRRLREWYPQAAAAYAEQPIGDDDFTFWRARFREWQGTTVKPVLPGQREPTNEELWADIQAQKALRVRR